MRTSTSLVGQALDGERTSTAPRPFGRPSRGLGWSIAAAATVTAVFLLSNSATPLYGHWQAEWGFESGLLTIIFATYIVGLVAALIIAGRLADRFGRKVVLVPGLAAAVIASVLFLAAQDVMWLLVARLLAGVAVGTAVTAGMAAVVDLAPEHRKRTSSLIASVSMVFGAGLGPLLAGGLAVAGSPSTQQLVFTVVLCVEVAALLVAIVLPLKRPVTQNKVRLLAWPSAPRENRRELRWGIGAFAPGITATSFVLSLGPTVLGHVGAPGAFVTGVVACAMFLVATGIQFALARLTTRAHLALSSTTAIAAMIFMVLAVTVVPFAAAAIIAALLAGAAQGLGQLAGLSLIATHITPGKRAESNAALNIGGYIPASIASVLVGYAADAFGLSISVTLFASTLTAAAIVALIATGVSVKRHTAESVTEGESA
ncbi:MFS transporter [Cryobacterium sp. TMT1-3]|uniref:MFS transporter n=2 Tax=Microbacteriaceae TaxID=85023 RepID=A0A1H8M6W1_9MICO|nr:MFS transporter [Cryobacterium luteum]TFC27677.1 MFS transporter [Cryobacterium sp. TMT1-3]SEO12876.1 Predicted arabinose efflux permease, MFS family [Cryobacterium luteum]